MAETKPMDVTEKEANLIKFLRENLEYGTVTVIMHEGEPRRLEAITTKVQL